MDQRSWEQAKELIADALKLPKAERDAFLLERCPDAALREEVTALLAEYDEAPGFLEPDTAPDLLADLQPGTRIGPYVIVDRIGRGGMAEVFLGSDPRLHRKVALKCLIASPAAAEQARIRYEARAAARITHPNIAAIYDVVEHEGRSFIVMEYVEGESLAARIKRERLPVDRVIAIGRQLAAALTAAHSSGVVHRDLKPANIQLMPDGSVKVLDFGVANAARVAASGSHAPTTSVSSRLGRPPAQAGTPPYMAPEQLLGRDVDERSDIYSLGVVLFEMATGRRPFDANDIGDLVIALAGGAPKADSINPTVPAALTAVIDRALQADATQRYGSAADVEAALAAIGSGRSHRAMRRWFGAAAAAAAVVATIGLAYIVVQSRGRTARPALAKTIQSVAVLPVLNLSGDPSQEMFADGMTDGLINTLGRVSGLKVTARTSVMSYKDRPKALPAIAADLHVDAVIEASTIVAKSAQGRERVRVTVNLIDPITQTQIWNETLERDLVDVLSIQSEIATAVAEGVKIVVTPDEKARLAARQVVDPEAYRLYLQGRQAWNRRTADGVKRALEYFNEAIVKDPSYALAHAGVADCYVLLAGDFGAVSRDIGADAATAAASRALALDPTLGEAYASLAFTNFFLKWDFVRAGDQFRQAIRFNPSYATAHHWYGDYLSAIGREDEALAEARRAQELDPLSTIVSRDVAWPLFFSRRYAEAIVQLEATLRQDPSYVPAERLLARVYAQKGDHAEGVRRFEGLAPRERSIRARCELAWAYALAGRRADAERELAAAQSMGSAQVFPYDLALVYTALNRPNEAFEALGRAYQERDSTMVNLRHDPRLDGLRGDSRFTQLVAQMRFPQ